jgi:hypothetical protein
VNPLLCLAIANAYKLTSAFNGAHQPSACAASLYCCRYDRATFYTQGEEGE